MKLQVLLCSAMVLSACASMKSGTPQEAGIFDRRTLAVGERDSFQTAPSASLLLLSSNPALATVVPGREPGAWEIFARARGEFRLMGMDAKGKISRLLTYNIISQDLFGVVKAVRRLTAQSPRLQVDAVEEYVVIHGIVKDTEEFDRIVKIEKAWPGKVVSLVDIDPAFYEGRARLMQEEIRKLPHMDEVTIRRMNDTFILEGKVDSYQEREKAEMIVQVYLPEIQVSPGIQAGQLIVGAKKYAVRNFLLVKDQDRVPAQSSAPSGECREVDITEPLPVMWNSHSSVKPVTPFLPLKKIE